jgi:hypothetical protein
MERDYSIHVAIGLLSGIAQCKGHPKITLEAARGLDSTLCLLAQLSLLSMLRKLVYGRADGMPNSLESMVVCECSCCVGDYIQFHLNDDRPRKRPRPSSSIRTN